MIFSLDIDGCWSEDPRCFLSMLHLLRSYGHEVIIVTGREQPMEKLQRLNIPLDIKIIVSGDRTKEKAAVDAGYAVGVWCDDAPWTISNKKPLNSKVEDHEL